MGALYRKQPRHKPFVCWDGKGKPLKHVIYSKELRKWEAVVSYDGGGWACWEQQWEFIAIGLFWSKRGLGSPGSRAHVSAFAHFPLASLVLLWAGEFGGFWPPVTSRIEALGTWIRATDVARRCMLVCKLALADLALVFAQRPKIKEWSPQRLPGANMDLWRGGFSWYNSLTKSHPQQHHKPQLAKNL